MPYIKMYAGNPTAGGTDGTEVSSNGTLTSPINAMVSAGQTATVKCAVRCLTGYIALVTIATATRDGQGNYTAGSDWIQVSDDGETWGSSIQIDDVVDENAIFYVKISGGSTGGSDNSGALRCYAEVDENV